MPKGDFLSLWSAIKEYEEAVFMYCVGIADQRYYGFSSKEGELEQDIFPSQQLYWSQRGFAIVNIHKKISNFGFEYDVHVPKFISNFWVEIIHKIELESNGAIEIFLESRLIFADGTEDGIKSGQILIPLKGLEKVNWSDDVDSRCLIYPEATKAREHIANMIRIASHGANVKKTTVIDRLGTHIIEGIPVFNAGDRLIWAENIERKPSVKWNPSQSIQLVIDPNCSEQDAEAGIMRILALSPEVGRLLCAFNILNIFREAFIASTIAPRNILYVHGLTGIKKTTYTNFQSHIYNRDKLLEQPTRLNASIAAAVKLLYEKSDCVLILDDLFPAEDKGIHKQQEKTLLEITRVIGDGIEPARMRGNKVAKAPPRCGVLFTGEYYIGKGSDAARLLPVNMTISIDNDKLSACQREPLILSTFYYYFIQWYITNFDYICNLLKEWFDAYRNIKTGIHDRLQETQFCMEASYKLFLTYRMEKGFISKEDALSEYDSFYQQLYSIVAKQNEHVYQASKIKPNTDYLVLIRLMYHKKILKFVNSIKDFEVKEHDGLIHKGHLYLRSEKMMKKIHTFEPLADFSDVLENLKKHDALKLGKNSNSRQLHGGKGIRFYAIKLAKLQ